jgi:hypothetical protein
MAICRSCAATCACLITSSATTTVTGNGSVGSPYQISVNTAGLSETIDDRVAALLVAGANITLTYNDAGNALTIASSGGGGGGICLSGTAAAVNALRLAGTLQPGCLYAVTDWVAGPRLLGPNLVVVLAVANNRLANEATIVTNRHVAATPAWSGTYNVASNAVTSLHDNLQNKISGNSNIGNFDWGNPQVTSNTVDDSSLLEFTIYGRTSQVASNSVTQSSTVRLDTGTFVSNQGAFVSGNVVSGLSTLLVESSTGTSQVTTNTLTSGAFLSTAGTASSADGNSITTLGALSLTSSTSVASTIDGLSQANLINSDMSRSVVRGSANLNSTGLGTGRPAIFNAQIQAGVVDITPNNNISPSINNVRVAGSLQIAGIATQCDDVMVDNATYTITAGTHAVVSVLNGDYTSAFNDLNVTVDGVTVTSTANNTNRATRLGVANTAAVV